MANELSQYISNSRNALKSNNLYWVHGFANEPTDATYENVMNLALANYQNDKQLELWNLNNEYNSPANQIERLVAAGLNPNLAYQSVSSGNSSSPAAFNMPNLKADPQMSRLARATSILQVIGTMFKTIQGITSSISDIKGYPGIESRNNLLEQQYQYERQRNGSLSSFAMSLGTVDQLRERFDSVPRNETFDEFMQQQIPIFRNAEGKLVYANAYDLAFIPELRFLSQQGMASSKFSLDVPFLQDRNSLQEFRKNSAEYRQKKLQAVYNVLDMLTNGYDQKSAPANFHDLVRPFLELFLLEIFDAKDGF